LYLASYVFGHIQLIYSFNDECVIIKKKNNIPVENSTITERLCWIKENLNSETLNMKFSYDLIYNLKRPQIITIFSLGINLTNGRRIISKIWSFLPAGDHDQSRPWASSAHNKTQPSAAQMIALMNGPLDFNPLRVGIGRAREINSQPYTLGP
jgi:hypothetical protein